MKSIKKWAMSVIGVALVWQAFRALSCVAMAHAEPAVAGDWHASQAAALGDTAVTWLLGALVILKVLEMALARIAPLTTTKLDDNAYAVVHGIRTTAEEILGHVRPPPSPPGPPLPAIVSGTIESKDGAS